MIFNTFSYFLVFLLPTAISFRLSPPVFRPWVIAIGGSLFFVKFSYGMAGVAGTLCLLMFLWESLVSRLYMRGSRWCILGLVQSVALLGVFKYWNFVTGLIFHHTTNPLIWKGAFLPLGISFFSSSSITTRGIGAKARRRQGLLVNTWHLFYSSRR